MMLVTLTAGMIGVAILIAMVICGGGVVLAVLGGSFLLRNRRARQVVAAPQYSRTVTAELDPTSGAISGEYEDEPQYANELAASLADVPELDRAASDLRLLQRERRRSIALVATGAVLAVAGAAMLMLLVTGLLD